MFAPKSGRRLREGRSYLVVERDSSVAPSGPFIANLEDIPMAEVMDGTDVPVVSSTEVFDLNLPSAMVDLVDGLDSSLPEDSFISSRSSITPPTAPSRILGPLSWVDSDLDRLLEGCSSMTSIVSARRGS